MQFLYPKFLWALLTLAIPIIIHFFNFRRYTTVYFSNVAFLQNIKKETKSRSKLRNILILFARLLALAFLVMAFAQPYIPNKKNTKIANTPHVAIYIDNSFSMDAVGKYGILIESAKIKAKEITEQFSPNAKYLLLTNDFLQMHQRFVSSDQLIEWIAQIKSTHIVRSQNDVISKISGLLPNNDTAIVHNVFILSDFQKNTIQLDKRPISDNMKLFAMPFINQTQSNLYVDSIWFETPGHYKGKQENLHIKVKNITDEAFTEIPLQLFINDTLKSSVAFNVKGNSVADISIPFTLWRSGMFKSSVVINDYPITFDNSLYFNFTIANKKNILVINTSTLPNYFEALYRDDENIVATVVDSNNIPYTKFSNYQVIILNDAVGISSGLTNQIVTYVENGGTFVFMPSTNGDIELYNNMLGALGMVSFSSYINQPGSITDVDLNNILFKSVFSNGLNEVRLPEYRGFYKINTHQKSIVNTLFNTESGSALFVQVSRGKGQYYISALPLNKESTDLGTHPLFVPLFYNIALFSSLPNSMYYWIKPSVYANVVRKSTTADRFGMIEHSTNKELMPKHHISKQSILVYPDANNLHAGYYSVVLDGNIQDYLSFNYDRTESELSYFSLKEVKELYSTIADTDISIIKLNNKKIGNSIQQQSVGRSLNVWFLWFVLMFFVSEMLLLKFLK